MPLEHDGSIAFRSMARQNIMMEAHGGGQVLISWQPGSRNSDRKGPGIRYTLQRHVFSDLLPPTRSYLVSTTSQ
jgi:hypothetical protein